MASAGGATARYVLLVVGLVLIVAGMVGAVSNQYLVGGGGCGASCPLIGNLVGTVSNASSAVGIVGASVKLYVSGALYYQTTTTTAGYYSFGGILAGGYLVAVSAAGYKPLNGSATVSPGTTATFNAQLAPLSSGGSGSGSGCTPVPNGPGCTPPPLPPGVAPLPTLPPGGNTTNGNQTKQPITTFNPSPLSVLLILFGAFLVVIGAAWKG